MKRNSAIVGIIVVLVLMGLITPVFALGADEKKEFDRILDLSLAELTKGAGDLLDKKYSDENWDAHKFPEYVFTNDSVETGYMVAVKVPKLLKKSRCYCFCDAMGHKNLLHCFWKKGKAGKAFDDHAANCKICNAQAMLAFLWKEMGASDKDISKGMNDYFIKAYHK